MRRELLLIRPLQVLLFDFGEEARGQQNEIRHVQVDPVAHSILQHGLGGVDLDRVVRDTWRRRDS
jgi:hypothetical protein